MSCAIVGPKRRLAVGIGMSMLKECTNVLIADRNFFLPILSLILAPAGRVFLIPSILKMLNLCLTIASVCIVPKFVAKNAARILAMFLMMARLTRVASDIALIRYALIWKRNESRTRQLRQI